ncbi:MAG TPA: glycerol-3-phosphate dehydrogenase/oxidase [Acidimicrobiales bacterium]|nr:glycerol-3-phosphate dehydrogenase/oxidase [Acidimicrobiales bacterium]
MPPTDPAPRRPGADPPEGPTSPPAAFDRSDALRRMRSERFDVLVIGGGVTGAGIALDAAARGLRTALVERNDFASGTSSKSSKMIHGGLRYLQQRDFRLVYEGLRERQRLLDNAPHLVSVLPFLIPLFGRGGVVNKSVARAYATALWLYDAAGGWRIGKRHRRIDRAETLAHLPTLRTDRLVAGFLYYDARADDARLTLAIARTAALDHGAVIANYTLVTRLRHDASGAVTGAHVRPVAPGDGEPGSGHGEFDLDASVVVNATGVWADEVRALDEGTHPHSLRPAKGIHVTVPRSKLPADIAAVIPVAKDRRSIFVVPWPDGDDVYLGTTDTAWDGPLDDPACLPEDVDYVLDAANAATTGRLGRDDVTGVWVGLRPLLAPGDGHHVSERTADLSRRHTVRTSPHGLVTVTGGKLTTYRRMAEDTVDVVVGRLGTAAPARARKSPTRRLGIRGAAGLAALRRPGAAAAAGLDDPTFAALVARHGGETPDVLAPASGRPELLEPLIEGLPYLRVEAVWAARQEMAMTVDDVLSRRTRATLRRAEAAAQAAPAMADMLAGVWGRDPRDTRLEAAAFAAGVHRDLARAGLAVGGPDRGAQADVAPVAGRDEPAS